LNSEQVLMTEMAGGKRGF